MRKITRRKEIPAVSASYDGTGRPQPDNRRQPALWAVFADGVEIGEYRNRIFCPTNEARARGEPFSHYGNWAKVKAALEALPNTNPAV